MNPFDPYDSLLFQRADVFRMTQSTAKYNATSKRTEVLHDVPVGLAEQENRLSMSYQQNELNRRFLVHTKVLLLAGDELQIYSNDRLHAYGTFTCGRPYAVHDHVGIHHYEIPVEAVDSA
ncbi:hypothetical protein [Exiguobacterium sp. S22-S28]|uniref:hypothetical protein n=1 Tax=Exiguobacterium sp. S22-S28 TaxID=3342768 RepID=UPI00372D5DB4